MGRERSTVEDSSLVFADELWSEHKRLVKKLYRVTGELKTVPGVPNRQEVANKGQLKIDILERRNSEMIDKMNEILKLKPPFPTALGTTPSRFGFYCWNGDRFCFHNFHAAYAAKYFIDYIVQGHKYKWLKDDTILTEKGIKIRGEKVRDLETILEYEYKGREEQWEPPTPYRAYWDTFLGRRSKAHAAPDPQKKVENASSTPGKAVTKDRSGQKAAKRKDTAAKGLVSISDIAEAVGITPREARGQLRSMKIPKPDHGWAWSKEEAASIQKRLKRK